MPVQMRLISQTMSRIFRHAPTFCHSPYPYGLNGILYRSLQKENKKFIYSVLREGARAKDLNWRFNG